MVKTMINIKADKDVKQKAQKIAKQLGLPLSTLINAYLKQFIRNKEVHFSAGYQMTSKLEKLLGRVEKDIKNNKDITGPFNSAKDTDEYLNSL